jgi:hypothetical protein
MAWRMPRRRREGNHEAEGLRPGPTRRSDTAFTFDLPRSDTFPPAAMYGAGMNETKGGDAGEACRMGCECDGGKNDKTAESGS